MTEKNETNLDEAMKSLMLEKQARADRIRSRVEAILAEERCDIIITAQPLGPNTFMFGVTFIAKD